jgi:hypothetical protein
LVRQQWEIKRDIAILEGLRNEAYNNRDYWYDELGKADYRVGYYKTLERQMEGSEKEKYTTLREEAQSRFGECRANIKDKEIEIDQLGAELAEFDKELAGDKTPSVDRNDPDLGDDFEDR